MPLNFLLVRTKGFKPLTTRTSSESSLIELSTQLVDRMGVKPMS